MRKVSKILCAMALGALTLTGCGANGQSDDEIMTTTEFKRVMEKKGLSVTDQTETAADKSYQEIYVAVDEEKYSFEYYFMKNPKSAVNVYNYAKDNLDKIYNEDENTKINEKNLSNGVKYSVSASDYYCEVIQKENTVLYVTAYPDYQKDAVEIIEELGV